MKVIQYTAISGNKDPLRKDIKCFTEYSEFKKPVLNAKIYKILPHKFLDYDISIWMDGNIFPLVSQDKLIELLGDNDLALWQHEYRNNVFEEIKAVQYFYPEHFLMAEKYKERLVEKGFKDDKGLGHCGILIRKNNDIVKRFCESWWSEITAHCTRDQLSFPYILSKFPDLKVKFIDEVKENECFKIINHYKNENKSS